MARKKKGTGFGTKHQIKPTNQDSDSLLWWSLKESEDAGQAMTAAAKGLQINQQQYVTRNYRCSQMYGMNGLFAGGRFAPNTIGGMGAAALAGLNTGSSYGRMSPRTNIVNMCVETVKSMLLASSPPTVTFLSNEGNFKQQQRAKKLNKYIEGLFYQCGVPEQASLALRDSLIFGTGFLKIDSDSQDNITVKRVWPGTVWTEMYDGRDGAPRSLYFIDYADKDYLKQRYSEYAEDIEASAAMNVGGFQNDLYASRTIPFYEAWRLPSFKGADDGRHICAVDNVTLVDEKWEDCEFPFASIRYQNQPTGFYGMGLAEILTSHQLTLTRVEAAEAYAHSQMSLPRLWVDITSKINRNHANSSRSGLILEGIGTPPTPLNWPAVTPDFVAFKNGIIESALQFSGVSNFMASGTKPQGLNSGAAQREYADIAQNRFAELTIKWGQIHVDLAKGLIAKARRIYGKDKESKHKLTVNVIGKGFITKMDWNDASLEDDEFVVECFPVASLPRTPAGRLQAVQEYMQANLMTPEEGKDALQFPDLDETMSLENVQSENAKKTAYDMLVEGKFSPPDSLQNLPLCIDIVQKEALRAKDAGAPEENIELARTWLVQARAEIQKALAPPPAPAPTAPQLPQPTNGLAQGAPTPQNPMLPFKQPK